MLADQPQPPEHERAVELDQARPGPDLGERGCTRIDAAGADQRERAFDPHIGLRQHAGREREQRPARQPARLLGGRLLAQPRRPPDRGIADDHAVDPARARDPHDVVELAEREIGRDLDQHRRRSGFPADAGARVDHARDQLVEHFCLLQVAQAGRVGRRDVDGEIAHHRRERLDQLHIVGDAVGAVLVGADIDADDAALIRTRREPAQHRVGALAVEAEPVDHGLVARQPKHARARIARLRPRRHGADLDEAEAEPEQCIGHLGMLVEPRRHPDRIGEIEAEGAHRKPRIVRHQLDEGRDLQRQDGEPVRVLGIEQAQQRPRELVEQADHGVSSGNTCRPSASSRSGFAHSTAASGSAP